MMEDEIVESWDLFISHASEDKDHFVAPLAAALSAFGIRVWYDEYELKIGDSLSRSIDKGLSNSDYGLVVLSPAFVSKAWPEYEIRGLTAREMRGRKVILPIWLNLTIDEVIDFSPPLADKMALIIGKETPSQIAAKIIENIRPDVFTKILRRIAHFKSMDSGKKGKIDPRKLRPSPIQHKQLPIDLVGRIRLVRAALIGVDPHSMSYWMEGFQRDAHPSDEVVFWERVACAYLEYVTCTPNMTREKAKEAYSITQRIALGASSKDIVKENTALPENAESIIRELFESPIPLFDFEEKPMYEDADDDISDIFHDFDKEHFPDLPNELIREIMRKD